MTTHLKCILLIASLIFIVYSNALSGQFLWDDESLILKNYWTQDVKYFRELFTHDLHAFSPRPTFYYRPLQSLSYLLDHLLFGWGLWKFHLMSVLLHVGVAILLYLLCLQLGFTSFKAVLVSLFFGLHPTLTASVSYLSGRADPLAAFWSLAALCSFLSFVRKGRKDFYIVSHLFFVLALLSKEVVLATPLIFLYTFTFFPYKKVAKRFWLLSGYLFLELLYLALRFHLFGTVFAKQESPPLSHLLIFSAKSILLYVKLIFLPFPLSMERYLSIRDPFWDLHTGIGVLFLSMLFFFWGKADSPRTRYGWSWFWIFLFAHTPVLLQTNRYAEHVLYFPLMGIGMVLVEGFSLLLGKRAHQPSWRWGMALFLLTTVTGLSLKTHLRNQDWRDAETFYQAILTHHPESVIALNNLAALYEGRGEREKGERMLRRVIELSPTYAEGHCNLGNFLLKQGRVEEAFEAYNKALAIRPESAEIHYSVASAYRLKGACQQALPHYERAISLKPYLIESHYFLEECYRTLGMTPSHD